MFWFKADRIEYLETCRTELEQALVSLRTENKTLRDVQNNLQIYASDRIKKLEAANQELGIRLELLESVLQQIRINVKLPIRKKK